MPNPLRRLRAALLFLVAAASLLLLPALAGADSASTLTVVGTSDVSDSGLVPNLIQPDFNKAFPQFTFKYVGSATGTAIQNAESGNGGPSALIVHAASLENQFVAGGYSYNNQFGNAIFTNDFLLAGPKADPAGVAANGATNIAQAFADVASAGNAGRATFISRGGTTTASGTTVEEHEIWGLVSSAGLTPAGVVLCRVAAADGGGMSPISSTAQATSGQTCPDSGTVNASHAPSWYFINSGANQGANVIATNACTVGHSGANTCYSLTDRGTYDYLSSGTSPSAGTAGIPSLTAVSQNNSAGAPGGQFALINYFHVYIINPSKAGEAVNLPAAQDLVSLLTSPTFQAQLKTYLASSPGGPPFQADASPLITATGLPRNYNAAKRATVKGTVTNAQPGFPAPANQRVTVDEVVGSGVLPVASGKTNSKGAYSISFTPPVTGSYEVSTPQISQVENATLSPAYGDILSPAATTPVKLTVHSAVTTLRVKAQRGRAVLLGTVSPGTGHAKATVTILARRNGKGSFKKLTTLKLGGSDANFAVSVNLATAKWQFEAKYQDPKQVVGATSKKVSGTVAARAPSTVTLKSATVKNGALTLKATLKPKPAQGGTTVSLLALRTSGTSARFVTVGKAKVAKGKTGFTVHAKLKRGFRYVLQLQSAQRGQATTASALKTINVK